MNKDTKVYTSITVSWRERSAQTICTLQNCTKQEALDRAKYFGYVEPKWFQFWKPTLTMVALNND